MRSNGIFKDRTNEFSSIAESLQNKFKVKGNEKPSRSDVVKQRISINNRASAIGRKTMATAAKLKELTELAKCIAPFGDPTEKIEQLTATITIEINNIKQEIEDLERFVGRTTGNKQSSDHSATVIHTLNSNLFTTTKDLNEALQLRTQNLKAQQDRMDKLTYGRRPGPSPTFRHTYVEDEHPDHGTDDVLIAVEVEEDPFQGRATAVRDIAVHISEIQTIFKKLSELVVRETEQLQRLEDLHDITAVQAESALAELLKYLKGLSSDRWLIVKAFLLIFFFLFLWFMFFA